MSEESLRVLDDEVGEAALSCTQRPRSANLHAQSMVEGADLQEKGTMARGDDRLQSSQITEDAVR